MTPHPAPTGARPTRAPTLDRVRMRQRRAPHLTHKASATAPLIAFTSNHQPVWTPRDYAAFAREGFTQNAIVYRSVRMIAEAAASVPLLLYAGANEIEDHPLLDLLRQPNPVSSRVDLLEAWYGYLLVSGNAYLEAVALGADIRELHALRPDRMKVVPGADGYPEAYDYAVSGQSVRLAGEPVSGVRRILHMKLFHPADDHYGLSPIEAAATAIDTHNTASRWNKALLDNSARPSGALVYTARDGNLSGEQYERLKRELEAGFQGAGNSGRPLLLEGGLDWKAMSLTPKDMDFLEAKHTAAREIALALGVPPMLLAIPGDNTFANYQEANRTFWRQTVLSLVARTCEALSTWLSPAYGDTLTLRADTDSLDALSSEREALWTRLEKASFLTTDEKRAAVGYGPMPLDTTPLDQVSLDQVSATKFNPHHAADGRFDFSPDRAQPIAGKPTPPKQPAPLQKPAQPVPPSPAGPVYIPPGTTIRNKALAGKNHPVTGIPFDAQGFPDFSGVAVKTVTVPQTGTRSDETAANKAAGLSNTPDLYTWHHHQNGYTMQLVPTDIHYKTGHTGGPGVGNLPGRR